MSYTIDRVTADSSQALTNASQTTIYSFAMPAYVLGTNKRVTLSLEGTILNNSGANRVYTFRVIYGATTMIADALATLPASATLRNFTLSVRLWGDNATNAQIAAATLSISAITAITTGLSGDLAAAPTIAFNNVTGTAAEDSTAAKTFSVTLQSDSAAATQTFITRVALLEVA